MLIDRFALFVVAVVLLSCSRVYAEPIQLSAVTIREHTPVGHLLITLSSSANRSSSYRFVSSSNHRYFALNSSTGELRLAVDIDRESICTHRRLECQFLLKIFELFNETLYHLPIIIEDINDHRPLFPYALSFVELHISENSPPYQSKLFIQQAYDHDPIDQQRQLKYQLNTTDIDHFPFRLETNDDLSNRLTLVLISALDRELVSAYDCTLHVTDSAEHEEQLAIRIIVDDVNDQSPM